MVSKMTIVNSSVFDSARLCSTSAFSVSVVPFSVSHPFFNYYFFFFFFPSPMASPWYLLSKSKFLNSFFAFLYWTPVHPPVPLSTPLVSSSFFPPLFPRPQYWIKSHAVLLPCFDLAAYNWLLPFFPEWFPVPFFLSHFPYLTLFCASAPPW